MSGEHFFNAIREGNKFRLERILALNPSLIHTKAQSGQSPLKYAFYCRQFSIAEILVAKGAKLET